MSDTRPVIVILDPSVAVTGAFIAARHTAQLTNDAVRMLLVLPEGCRIPPEQLSDFWRVEYIPLPQLRRHISTLLRYLPLLLVSALRLKKLIRTHGATRLQLNDFYLAQGAVLRLLGYRGIIVSWVRCDPAQFAGSLAKPLLWLMRASANRVIAVSHFVRMLLPASITAELLYDAYHGPVRAPRAWTVMQEKPLVYIGNYIAGKGQDMALEAFAIAAANDKTITLHFYGGDMGLPKNRAYRAALEGRAQQLGVAGRITFHESTTDPFAVLETAYAALNFSARESFSMTVLEASGAGVPVVATASGGPQEIIVEGVTGYLVPVRDVAAAAARILTLAQDPAQSARMGDAAAAHINAQFSPAQFRAKYLRALGV